MNGFLHFLSHQPQPKLKIVCAWCEPGVKFDVPVSHGICAKHKAQLLQEISNTQTSPAHRQIEARDRLRVVGCPQMGEAE